MPYFLPSSLAKRSAPSGASAMHMVTRSPASLAPLVPASTACVIIFWTVSLPLRLYSNPRPSKTASRRPTRFMVSDA